MRIAVVDDDAVFRKKIVDYISEYYDGDTSLYSVRCYGNGLDFLSEYKCNFDIVLLDIQMPKICGMDVANEIRKTDEDVIIMFITQTSSFAIRGYEVNALDYKPEVRSFPLAIECHGFNTTSSGFRSAKWANTRTEKGYICYVFDFVGGAPNPNWNGGTLSAYNFHISPTAGNQAHYRGNRGRGYRILQEQLQK